MPVNNNVIFIKTYLFLPLGIIILVHPKLFISYSWSNTVHEQWVLSLATNLSNSGVDVIFDKWDLKEGYDVYTFMEKMVTDPNIEKVAIISDRNYAEKSYERQGGVGTETQIISKEVYENQEQNKFVVIVSEKDDKGNPFLPTYSKSRVFIDLSEPDTYNYNYEKLLRWIYNKPLYTKPKIGKKPTFLSDNNPILATVEYSPKRNAFNFIAKHVTSEEIIYADGSNQDIVRLKVLVINGPLSKMDHSDRLRGKCNFDDIKITFSSEMSGYKADYNLIQSGTKDIGINVVFSPALENGDEAQYTIKKVVGCGKHLMTRKEVIEQISKNKWRFDTPYEYTSWMVRYPTNELEMRVVFPINFDFSGQEFYDVLYSGTSDRIQDEYSRLRKDKCFEIVRNTKEVIFKLIVYQPLLNAKYYLKWVPPSGGD